MKILLTNDDGYAYDGIQALFRELKEKHEVVMVAPDREKSAVGHGISLGKPLRLNKLDTPGPGLAYAVNGTPADCVKLGLFEVFETPPDLVISGINPGSNTGINIYYSGTAAAAREACLNGILGIAVSLEITEKKYLDFKGMARFIGGLINKVHAFDVPTGTFLNINGPDNLMQNTDGVAITRVARRNLATNFDRRLDPKERPYFWYGSEVAPDHEPETDISALMNNCISVSPVQCDPTDHQSMKMLKEITSVSSAPLFRTPL